MTRMSREFSCFPRFEGNEFINVKRTKKTTLLPLRLLMSSNLSLSCLTLNLQKRYPSSSQTKQYVSKMEKPVTLITRKCTPFKQKPYFSIKQRGLAIALIFI